MFARPVLRRDEAKRQFRFVCNECSMASEEELKGRDRAASRRDLTFHENCSGPDSDEGERKGRLPYLAWDAFRYVVCKQWEQFLGMADGIRSFITKNKSALKKK